MDLNMKIRLPGTDNEVRPGKLLCIGRNYAKHIEEMQSEVPDQPVVFLKPSTSLVRHPATISIPSMSKDVHHEVELVAVVGKTGKNIEPEDWREFVAGYAVGLDMTARDIQQVAKEKGTPWSIAKGFDSFAPLGEIVSADGIDDPHHLEIELSVNHVQRQKSTTALMLFPLPTLIAFLSRIFTLEPGDLIYTGTPQGVAAVHPGDELIGRITGLPDLRASVVIGS